MPTFLGRPVPPAFDVRSVAIRPGGSIPFRGADWEDAIVSVEEGELEAECLRGGRRRFGAGSLLYFDGLPLRALHSTGATDLVLVAISRPRPMSSGRATGPMGDDEIPRFQETG